MFHAYIKKVVSELTDGCKYVRMPDDVTSFNGCVKYIGL